MKEFPDYYERLERMEREAERDPRQRLQQWNAQLTASVITAPELDDQWWSYEALRGTGRPACAGDEELRQKSSSRDDDTRVREVGSARDTSRLSARNSQAGANHDPRRTPPADDVS